jgi:hypothetical protein
MEYFINNWRRYIYAMWLGGSLAAVFDASVFDIKFWLVLLPTGALVKIFNDGLDSD